MISFPLICIFVVCLTHLLPVGDLFSFCYVLPTFTFVFLNEHVPAVTRMLGNRNHKESVKPEYI